MMFSLAPSGNSSIESIKEKNFLWLLNSWFLDFMLNLKVIRGFEKRLRLDINVPSF